MKYYHIGFGQENIKDFKPEIVFLSGDPSRAAEIAQEHLLDVETLSENRGLNSYVGNLKNGVPAISATSGMGGPSLSIVVNELVQVGITTFIRIGTCGSIQDYIPVGDVVITKAALCRQGAALDIAPVEYPAVSDPRLVLALERCAKELSIPYHTGITASVDTFFEGQERTESSANPHLQPWLRGITGLYRSLNVLNYEMESGTLLKMAGVYGFKAVCICGVVAQRTTDEQVKLDAKGIAIERAISIAIHAAQQI